MTKFDFAFNYLLGNEGVKYTNDPRDSGGPTKFGITLNRYEQFLGRLVTSVEIQNLTEDDAKSFYETEFWKIMACDRIDSAAIATCIFDSAILYGPGTAGLMAQKATSLLTNEELKFDGFIGDTSVRLLNSLKEDQFLKTFQVLLLRRIDNVIAANPKNEVFRNGWTSRANRVLTLNGAQNLINE